MYRDIRAAAGRGRAAFDAVAAFLFDNTRRVPSEFAGLDRSTGGALGAALKREEFSAARGSICCLYPDQGPKRLYLLGLGPADGFDGSTLRVAAARLAAASHAAKLRNIRLELGSVTGRAVWADRRASALTVAALVGRAVGDGLSIGNFSFDTYKAKPSGSRGSRASGRTPTSLSVHVDQPLRGDLAFALRTGASVDVARELAATPPNVAGPSWIVSYCRKMARATGLRCSVIGAAKARTLGLRGLLAVGAAGSSPPALICLEHRPAKSKRGARPVMLVGKTITFDTGGYSLKPATSMDGMKYDKCGGTAVIGAMHAIARHRLPTPVVALLPVAENMVSHKGYRPGDILRMHNGVTVEVTNTDAEGRLVLADALSYGCARYRPRAIVDLATLTGGVVVALGSACAGAFCTDEDWWSHLARAADDAGERLWRLPLWDQHREMMKTHHADIVNSAGREAHPIQGAAFLSHFVDAKVPWAHLDIAGVSDLKKPDDLHGKGPTGFGVRLLVRAVESL